VGYANCRNTFSGTSTSVRKNQDMGHAIRSARASMKWTISSLLPLFQRRKSRQQRQQLRFKPLLAATNTTTGTRNTCQIAIFLFAILQSGVASITEYV